MQKRLKQSFTTFIFISFGLHILFLLGLQISEYFNPPASKPEYIEFEITDSTKDLQQVIEQDKKQFNDETPEKTSYLGRYNQKVVKETKAQKNGEFKNTAGSGGQKAGRKKITQRKKPRKKLPSLAALSPRFKAMPDYDEIAEQSNAGGPESATNDYLKDVAPSIETMLNSREFVYYTYYQRIRRQIRQHWEPSIRGKVKKIFQEGRQLASSRDHITKVVIVLDPKGSLRTVKVLTGSGVHDLDDAAVEAFRAAEPFPNPPEGMIESDGTIKIRWDFVLESA